MKKIERDYKVISNVIKIIGDELQTKYEVIGPDGFVWNSATTPTGAVQGALAVGVPLRKIDYNQHYVDYEKIKMVIK